MTTSTTDTAKRLSDVQISQIMKRHNDFARSGACQMGKDFDGANADRASLLSHIAALTASPSQGKVERAREIAARVVAAKMIRGEMLGFRSVVELCATAISAALTEPVQDISAEAAAILRTLGSAPDSMDLSETDAAVSVGFLRRLLAGSTQGTSVEAMPAWSDLKFDQRRDISTLLTQTAGARTRYENLRGYLRTALPLPVSEDGSAWRPIETAPKDREIIVCGGDYMQDGCIFDDWYPLKDITLVAHMPDIYSKDKVWRGENAGGHDEYFWYRPTHWMEKPKPLKSTKHEGEGE